MIVHYKKQQPRSQFQINSILNVIINVIQQLLNIRNMQKLQGIVQLSSLNLCDLRQHILGNRQIVQKLQRRPTGRVPVRKLLVL